MNDTPKTAAFEFDPLPGDAKPAEQPTQFKSVDLVAPKKRGRKPKPEKKERKKRGPRRVQAPMELIPVAAIVAEQPLAKKIRKRREHKDLPELSFIQLLMHLTEKQRKRVMFALNKIFPA